MPGIGLDISEVIEELGVTATIYRTPANLTEKLVYDVNALSANAFLRENMLNVSFKHNTIITTGDVIQFHAIEYLVINKTPDDFEDEITEYAGVVYKCNLPAGSLILSPTKATDPTTYKITQGWAIRKSDAKGLLTQDKRSTEVDAETSTGKVLTFALECFVPAHYGVEINDRLYINATTFYRVQDIEQYRFPDVHVLSVVKDDRLVYTL
jgi:hypothetical protein